MVAMSGLADIGVIGGSGLYSLELLGDCDQTTVVTPFGKPSGPVVVGTLAGRRVAFLARHGEGHQLSPSEVPYRANIYALRSVGARQILAVSAVGSLAQEYAPGDLVVPDQLLDRTRGIRERSFFGNGAVAHVAFAEPFCGRVRTELLRAAALLTSGTDQPVARGSCGRVHDGGTYCCIEGPLFSTRAESELYRRWGLDIIGMTAVPEAALAREAEVCYATLALVTDYDCWHDGHADVSAEMVADVMHHNVVLAQSVIAEVVTSLRDQPECACHHALDTALLTSLTSMSPAVRERLGLLLRRRLLATSVRPD